MPGLFTTLTTAAESMRVFEKALDTVSNNVANANTPGYAKQFLPILAQPFDPVLGLPGGIAAGPLQSSRDEYAEQTVRQNQQGYGLADQSVTELSAIEPLFDVTGESGIGKALNALFQSFSALSVSPNDNVVRTNVISSATDAAEQFNSVAAGLNNASVALNGKIQNAADTINGLTQQISQLNTQIQGNAQSRSDPAVDASLHNALESLAEYVDIVTLRQPDGSVTVLMGGQTPLVMGDRQYAIAAAAGNGTAVVQDSFGNDVTAELSGGRLKALIDMKNTVLPGFSNDLNRLAAAVSDGVNNTLAQGVDAQGNQGATLFAYDPGQGAAFTMSVTDITADQLAAALPGAVGGNGNALNLTALANSQQIDGMNFTQFYGSLASRVGQSLNASRQDQQTQQDLLAQARSTRSASQSVSIDEEAIRMLEFQRAYQAAAKVVSVLNDLTDTVIGMLQQ
jgi:flagellar hook-associated protein 1 FlgK